MPNQTPSPHDDWRQSDDHDVFQALIAENLAADDPGDW